MKSLLAITVAGQTKWLEEAISTLQDDLDVLVIDDATPGINDVCSAIYDRQKRISWITKDQPMGLTNSWNLAYQHFKKFEYDNCILSNDDVRFPKGFSERLIAGLKEFDLIAPLSNEPGIIWDSIHSPAHQEIRRYVDIKPNQNNADRIQQILSLRGGSGSFKRSKFINGFCLAFSQSIAKYTYDEQFLFNPAHINTFNEYDLAERINEKGGKIGICKTSYVFHWKGKTTEKLNKNGVSSGDYRNQLWK